MENWTHHHGSSVAFEGPENLVSTQLRLLPASPQLLILPSLQYYMKGRSNTPFDSRTYIKDLHEAALARHEAASRFLSESTNSNKRLVFLNGGTAGAVAQCISAISEHQTSGNAILAEAIYRNIASEGLKGLDQEEKYADHQAFDISASERDQDEALWEDDYEDRIIKAMRAADALYRETDSLQPLECYIKTRPRSLSLPAIECAAGFGQASPFFVFSSTPSENGGSVFEDQEEEAATTGREEDANGTRTVRKLQAGPKLRITVPPRPAGSIVETLRTRNIENQSTVHVQSSPTPDSIMSPCSPEGVVYGEARLVQMAASKSQKKLRRVRSLDDMELNETRRRRSSTQLAHVIKRAVPIDSPPEARSRHLSIVDDPYSPNNLLGLGQAQFVKAQTTTIRRSPTFPKGALTKPLRQTYVHHGTDALDVDTDIDELEGELEPVLPLHEDLVVHFTSFGRHCIMDSVIQSLKNGAYPITSSTSESFDTAESDSGPSTPRTADLFDLESHADGLSPVAEVPSADEASDYDPYAARGTDVRLAAKMMWQRSGAPLQTSQQPPTPAQTPTPHVEAKFHDFSTAGRTNAIATQNALRVVLEGYYPQQEGTGYSQYDSALLPDMNKLWRPIFRVSETEGGKATQSTADLILALGCQQGVESEFVATVTGQIEKLGSKSNGMSRSGRLDMRYLIAAMMQSSSTHSLTSLATSTYTDSPYALACLLIPHLETYLAINTATRFLLLSYPAEHLATVISLQKLIGADTFKVAGILDTSDANPTPNDFASPSPSSTACSSPTIPSLERLLDASCPGTPCPEHLPHPPPLLTATHRLTQPLAHRRRMSFSRADYILASSATVAEITHLLSTLTKLLVDVDAFYTPEPASTTILKPALVSKFTGASVTVHHPSTPPLSPPYFTSVSTPRSIAAINFPYAPPPPPAEREGSPSQQSRSRSRSRERGRQPPHISAATANATRGLSQNRSESGGMASPRSPSAISPTSPPAVSVVGEDEFYDDEERRLMPMYMRQNELRKGNSRKALKWLGLA